MNVVEYCIFLLRITTIKQKLKPTLKKRTKEKNHKNKKEELTKKDEAYLDQSKLIEENEGCGKTRTCNLQICRRTRQPLSHCH